MRIEHWWFKLPLRLKSIFRRRRVETELDEELQFHLEHKIQEGLAEGLSPGEARYRALRAMGGLEQRKEEVRDTRGIHWLTDFVDDVRYAARSLRRTPGLALFVVVTIALGIGMTATPFSMLDALVFRPYPVPDPGHVVTLVGTSHDSAFDPFSYREYLDIRDRTKSYAGVIANMPLLTVGFSAQRDVAAVAKGGLLVSGNYFRVLDVEPTLGRGFRDDEDQVPGRDAVVVLSARLLEARVRGRPRRRRPARPLERKGLHGHRRAAGKVHGPLHLRPPRRLHAARDGTDVLGRRAEGLLRRPRRPRAHGEGAPEARHHPAAGEQRARRARPEPGARVSGDESRPRRGRPDHVRDADAGERRQLEIRRDLHDARARRAARGVHQCRRAASSAPARGRARSPCASRSARDASG